MPINEYRQKAQEGSLEWLNENMHRNYPIEDNCTVQSTNGEYLPSNFIVDLHIDTPSIAGQTTGATERFYIYEINKTGGAIQVIIAYKSQDGTSFPCAQSTSIPTTLTSGDAIASRKFILSPTSGIPDSCSALKYLSGELIIGTCQDIVDCGSFVFDYANATILSTCINMHATGLDYVKVKDSNGTEIGEFTNNFIIQAGDGISFTIDETGTVPILYINRVKTTAEEEAEYKTVDEVVQAVKDAFGTPVKSINGLSGDVMIQGEDCTEVQAAGNAISIKNTCSKPCCKNSDAVDVTSSLQSMEDMKTRLQAYFEALANNVNIMQSRLSSLIASRR